MVKFLPCIYGVRRRNSGESPPPDTNLHSESSSSSSNSSLSSQTSLPSTPSPAPDSTARHHCSATIRAHSSYVFSLAIAGNLLLSASSSGDLRALDLHPNNHHSPSAAAASHSAVKSIVVLNDGHRLFTAHHDHKIRAWKIQTHNNNNNSKSKRDCFNTTQTHNHKTTNKTTTNSINNKNKSKTIDLKLITTLPTARDRWFMNIVSAKNYVEIRRHKKCAWVRHADAVSGLALSPDGLRLYSVSWDRSMKVWRTRSGFRCAESVPNAHDDAINAVVCSPNGLVFTGSADKTIKVWKLNDDSNKGRHVRVSVLEGHKSAVNALALSENGSVLYSGGCDRSVIVWDMRDNDEGGVVMVVAGKLRGHRKAILCLAAVGDLVCSGSADRTVRVWRRLPESDGGSGGYSCLAVLQGHLGPVKCLAASRDFNHDVRNDERKNDDGKLYRVYSGGLDFDIKVWEIWAP